MTTIKIHASLGAKLLRNADRYFTNSAAAIFDEMVQNARRADATEISFTFENQDLIIEDNGKGLAAENAGVLLTLGGSDNPDSIEAAENAAGMGFLCLAAYDVDVASRDWTMSIPKDAFTGVADATLVSGRPLIAGFRVAIRGFLTVKHQDAHTKAPGELANTIRKATAFSGLTATICGTDHYDGVLPPTRFLDQFSDGEHTHQELTTHGVTVRLVRYNTSSNGVNARLLPGTQRGYRAYINFHGKCLTLKHSFPNESVARIAGGSVVIDEYATVALIDVQTSVHLKLQLPQRDAVIETPFLNQIPHILDQLYVKLLHRPGLPNGLPLGHDIRARHDGKTLPAPRARVVGNDGAAYLSTPTGLHNPKTGITVPLTELFPFPSPESEGTYIHGLFHPPLAVQAKFLAGTFNESDLDAAYDVCSRPSLMTVYAIVVMDGREHSVCIYDHTNEPSDEEPLGFRAVSQHIFEPDSSSDELNAIRSRTVESAALNCTFRTADGRFEHRAVPIPALFWANDDCYLTDEPTVLIALDNNVVDRLMASIPWNNLDEDYEPQRDWHLERYTHIVYQALGQSKSYMIEKIRQLVANEIYNLDPGERLEFGDTTLAISINFDKGSPVVTVAQ